MCLSCYRDYDYPVADSPEIRAAAKAIDALYEIECTGGALHIHVDDWNLDDCYFDQDDEDYIKKRAFTPDEYGDIPGENWYAIHMDCFRKLKALSEEHRVVALALSDSERILRIDEHDHVVMAQDWKQDETMQGAKSGDDERQE